MQLITKTPVLDLEGRPILINPNDPESNPLMVKALLVNALLMSRQSDAQLNGEEKLKRFQLAQKIHDNDIVDLSLDDAVKLKILSAESYSTLIYARLANILDPPTNM